MTDVTERTLALLSTLQNGRPFTGDELATRLGVSPRTLRRDIDRLRAYGYPVETRPGPGGHYRLAAGTVMPPLMLGDDEAIATLIALAAFAAIDPPRDGSIEAAATRAYGKVDQYLPKRLRGRAADLRASLEMAAAQGPSAHVGDLTTIADAIRDRQIVAFDYRRKDGDTASRRVEPHRQVHHHLRWYLLGWDLGKRDWRVFRIDRMERLRATGPRFTPRSLPAETAVAYLDRGLNRRRARIVITIEASAETVADAFRFQKVELTPIGDQRTRAVMWLDTWEWLMTSLAFLDADFTVEEPEHFRDAMHRFGARLRGK